jgi:ATP:ADP antiporter, AAA family
MKTPAASRPVVTAMIGAAAVTAQFVSGKAVRDALFLTSLNLAALPAMLIATSVGSMLIVVAHGRAARRIAPATLVPASFAVSGVLFLIEWILRPYAPSSAAILVYLHISGAGPLLASGFWLIASERFDPRTAKQRYGHIAAAGTLGGLVSALLTERVAAVFGVPAMLVLLAVLQLASAWFVRQTALSFAAGAPSASSEGNASAPLSRSAMRVLRDAPYLRNLGALVLLGTTGAALVDYLFKAQAIETFGRGDNLLRFFALYYAATSLIAFALQTSASRAVLERFGLGVSAGTPSVALLAGSLAGLVAPGFGSLLMARGGESVFRSSFFRAGYELFYTPIPADEKRAAKTLIDVGFDRLGDGVGGGFVRVVVALAPAWQSSAILSLAVVCSGGALVAASRLNRGYLGTLGNSLVDLSKRAGGIDPLANEGFKSTRLIGLIRRDGAEPSIGRQMNAAAARGAIESASLDPDLRDILSLRSRNRARVVEVLSREDGIAAGLVPHAITLLAWDQVADHAMFALRKVAEERIGELVDALLDPNQDFAVRRRLARVMSVCVSQRAASGLMFGLDDPRFDVRYQSARSLAAIVEKNPLVRIDREQIFAAVLREVAVGRGVWESRRLLEGTDAADGDSTLDAFVRTRAGESLGHVFTLLSLVLPREPLQIAFRSLQTDDEQLRGTALEYLEGVMPAAIRQRLWPFIDHPRGARPARPRGEAIAELLRSNQSIMLNLEELRRRASLVSSDSAAS